MKAIRVDSAAGELSGNLKIWVPNGAVLGVITLADLKLWLEVTLLVLSIAYTVWRWRRDAKKKE